MIYLEMHGRLGNQLFRYAFAKKVSLIANEDLVIDFSNVYKKNKKNEGWDNSLKLFKIKDYIEDNDSLKKNFFKNASLTQLFLYFYYRFVTKILYNNKNKLKKFQLKMQPLLNKNNIYFLELGYYNYDFKYIKNNKVKYICGCFEDSKYFNDIRDVILNEFVPKNIQSKNVELLNVINTSNSVCITVRRGNFVTDPNNKKIYDICDIAYFEKAIEVIKEKIENPVFIVFSDDIEWCKSNFKIKNAPIYFESGTDTLDEKLRLMSSCKNFIISNSTFSWWAQYLSKNDKKIVISPNIWYANNMESGLIEDDWIKIKVREEKE